MFYALGEIDLDTHTSVGWPNLGLIHKNSVRCNRLPYNDATNIEHALLREPVLELGYRVCNHQESSKKKNE